MTEETVVIARPPLWQRALKWVGLALLGLVVLAGVLVLGLNTAPGRRIIANSLGGYTTASGLNIKVGRIEGSLYGAMVLTDVRVSDPKGVFLTAPRIAVDWRPFAYLGNHIDVRSAQAALVTCQILGIDAGGVKLQPHFAQRLRLAAFGCLQRRHFAFGLGERSGQRLCRLVGGSHLPAQLGDTRFGCVELGIGRLQPGLQTAEAVDVALRLLDLLQPIARQLQRLRGLGRSAGDIAQRAGDAVTGLQKHADAQVAVGRHAISLPGCDGAPRARAIASVRGRTARP